MEVEALAFKDLVRLESVEHVHAVIDERNNDIVLRTFLRELVAKALECFFFRRESSDWQILSWSPATDAT